MSAAANRPGPSGPGASPSGAGRPGSKNVVRVHLGSAMRSYTSGAKTVEAAAGPRLENALADLERQFKGLVFRIVDEQGRIRQHINIFVNEDRVSGLDAPVGPGDEIHILMSLSGG